MYDCQRQWLRVQNLKNKNIFNIFILKKNLDPFSPEDLSFGFTSFYEMAVEQREVTNISSYFLSFGCLCQDFVS